MIRLLRFLFTGDWHLHKWVAVQKNECTGDSGGRWTRFYCRCDVCGKYKTFDPD
jgi:hypothetical protein